MVPTGHEPTDAQVKQAAETLIKAAVAPLATQPALRQLVQELKKQFDQIIDEVSQDELLADKTGVSAEARDRARTLVVSFETFLEEHKGEIAALQFFYSVPHRNRLHYGDIKELARTITAPPRSWTPEKLWRAYELLDKDKARGASGQRQNISAGKSFKCDERPPDDGEVGVVKVSALTWGTYDERESKTCTRAELINLQLLIRQGDFLFSRANTIELVGACVIAENVTRDVMLSDKIMRFEIRPDWKKWLLWSLRSSHGRAEIERLATGNQDSMRNIGQEQVMAIRIPVPAHGEQLRIVEAIESYFTRLDDALATLERVERNLKRYQASVLKSAVEGRLVPTEAQLARQAGHSFEPAIDLLTRFTPPPRPNRWNSRSSDVVLGHAALAIGNPRTTLPEGWSWIPLVDVARMESGHTPSRAHSEWWDGDVPWLSIPDARDHDGRTIRDTTQHTNAAGLANSAARILPSGTVSICRTAFSIGYVVVLGRPMATSQDFVNWTPTGAVSSHWLRVVFGADREALRRFGKGSVNKTIYFPEWLSIHIALPPLAEQERIVKEIDRLLSLAQSAEASVWRNLRQCDKVRQSILKWAFEGKLVDQDPKDEPAFLLLERIKGEREAGKSTKATVPQRGVKKKQVQA